MAFRRFSRLGGRRSGGGREPVMFDRREGSTGGVGTNIAAAGAAGVAAFSTLFDPTNVIAGMQDLRLTLRRLRVLLSGVATLGGAGGAVANDVFTIFMGITLASPAETPDPAVIGATGQRDDWLWLYTQQLQFTGAAPQSFSVIPTYNLKNQIGLIDVRAMRKIDQDQTIQFVAKVNTAEPSLTSAHTVATATLQFQLVSSALYSRTMKR